MLHVEMRSVNKWFADFHVLRDINLEVASGERIVICGPSGSGKSTLIRCLRRCALPFRGWSIRSSPFSRTRRSSQ